MAATMGGVVPFELIESHERSAGLFANVIVAGNNDILSVKSMAPKSGAQ